MTSTTSTTSTTTPATAGPPTLNGIVIGQAERATRAVLEVLLADVGVPFEQWVSLNLLGTQGPQAADSLVEQLVAGFASAAPFATAAVDGVRAAGLVHGSTEVSLTPAGQDRFGEITAGIAAVSGRLYGGLPGEDLVVARRVLETITTASRVELARTGASS